MKAKIFLSYTLTKSIDRDITAKIIEIFRDAATRNDVAINDVMKSSPREYAEISQDVVDAIVDSDCLFVLDFPCVPNTVYEAGIAFSLGIPTFHWLPDRKIESSDPTLTGYLAHLGHTDGMLSLPSDQGDRRYWKFPTTLLSEPQVEKRFRETVANFIGELTQGPLAEPATRARRALRELSRRAIFLTQKHVHDAPLCWVVESLCAQMHEYLSKDGEEKFVIDESIYPSFLKALDRNPSAAASVVAVADLTSGIERFWEMPGFSSVIGERVFRISPLDFYDEQRLTGFLRFARRLSELYPIYLTDMDQTDRQEQQLRFGVSGDYVLYRDLVGDYVEVDRTPKLRMEKNPHRSANLRTHFEAMKSKSVRITSTSTAFEIKREWLKKRKIGKWRGSWKGGHRRSESYYNQYEQHIRCWIPYYEELSSRVAGAVTELVQQQPELFGNALVGEIGCGTGSVTRPICRWTDSHATLGVASLRRYVYVDVERRMLEATQAEIQKYNGKGLFEGRRDPDFRGLASAVGPNDKYDVICGSLILHYLTSNGFDLDLAFLELDRLLSRQGAAVFGSCFFSEDAAIKSKQLSWWLEWMERNGLERDIAQEFIDKNAEMTEMPSIEKIADRFQEKFTVEYQSVIERDSPFGVLLMRRCFGSHEANTRLLEDVVEHPRRP